MPISYTFAANKSTMQEKDVLLVVRISKKDKLAFRNAAKRVHGMTASGMVRMLMKNFIRANP